MPRIPTHHFAFLSGKRYRNLDDTITKTLLARYIRLDMALTLICIRATERGADSLSFPMKTNLYRGDATEGMHAPELAAVSFTCSDEFLHNTLMGVEIFAEG